MAIRKCGSAAARASSRSNLCGSRSPQAARPDSEANAAPILQKVKLARSGRCACSRANSTRGSNSGRKPQRQIRNHAHQASHPDGKLANPPANLFRQSRGPPVFLEDRSGEIKRRQPLDPLPAARWQPLPVSLLQILHRAIQSEFAASSHGEFGKQLDVIVPLQRLSPNSGCFAASRQPCFSNPS